MRTCIYMHIYMYALNVMRNVMEHVYMALNAYCTVNVCVLYMKVYNTLIYPYLFTHLVLGPYFVSALQDAPLRVTARSCLVDARKIDEPVGERQQCAVVQASRAIRHCGVVPKRVEQG